MNERPKIDVRLYRPQFIVEKDLAEIKEAEDAAVVRTCEGYRTNPDRTISETVCGNPLSCYLGRYCSGECMGNAKKNGTYRND